MISNQMRTYRNYSNKLIIGDMHRTGICRLWCLIRAILQFVVFSLFRGERQQDDKTKSREDDNVQANRRNFQL